MFVQVSAFRTLARCGPIIRALTVGMRTRMSVRLRRGVDDGWFFHVRKHTLAFVPGLSSDRFKGAAMVTRKPRLLVKTKAIASGATFAPGRPTSRAAAFPR